MTSTETLIDAIEELARNCSAEELSEVTVSLLNEAVYSAAVEAFGGWDVALATALKRRLTADSPRKKSVVSIAAVPEERTPHPSALRPILVLSSGGFLLRIAADWLSSATNVARAQHLSDWSDALGQPSRFFDLSDKGAVALIANDGRGFGCDTRLIPQADEGDQARRIGAVSGVTGWCAVHDRQDFERYEYFISVSREGRIKVSKTSVIPFLAREGVVTFLLDEGDTPVTAALADRANPFFLASSNGFAIHFKLREVRPQGLKAKGVLGMQLRDGATIVGGFSKRSFPQVAFVTQNGYGKRVSIDEFRTQSRAGLGLVAMKLASGDAVSAIAPCEPNSDLLITTAQGRCLRVPTTLFPVMGRPAKGNRVIDLAGGDRVSSLATLLPMQFQT